MSSKPNIEVCLSPLLLHLFEPKDKVVVIIDILRATSTICTIIDNGAKSVIPVGSIEDCKKFSGLDNHILAAERQGKKAEGFTHGNSPFDFPPEEVAGKTVVLTTTNGTRALKMSEDASDIVIGAFINISALCAWLSDQKRDTILFCAGWKNHLNFEDSVFAGAVIDKVKNDFNYDLDSTLAVRYLYKQLQNRLDTAIRFSSHYNRLANLGVKKDIEYCMKSDLLGTVPILKGEKLVDLHRLTQETTDTSI